MDLKGSTRDVFWRMRDGFEGINTKLVDMFSKYKDSTDHRLENQESEILRLKKEIQNLSKPEKEIDWIAVT